MARRQMTRGGKIIIIGLFLGIIGILYSNYKDVIIPPEKQVKSILSKKNVNSKTEDVTVCVVPWGGYAGLQLFNNGPEPNDDSRFLKEYNLRVHIKSIDDITASRNAWKSDQVQVLWCTVDSYPTETEGLQSFKPRILWQSDWSRKGDATIATVNVKSIKDAKGKKWAFALGSPSHSYVLNLLEAAGMEYTDIIPVPVGSAPEAAKIFKAGGSELATVWSPDDNDCIKNVRGAWSVSNTGTATNIIADAFYVKEEEYRKRPQVYQALYEGWMIGAGEINNDSSAKTKAASILSAEFNLDIKDCVDMLNNVRLTTHGDNLNFFGLNSSYRGVTAEQMYNRMTRLYSAINLASTKTPSWREVYLPDVIRNSKLTGTKWQEAEPQQYFDVPTVAMKNVNVVKSTATKMAYITFATGSAELDENAKTIVDIKFTDIVQSFAGQRFRIVGHTDNVGDINVNQRLSERRAESAKQFLVQTYNFNSNKFVTVGMGQNMPQDTNETESGRAKNRRVELQMIQN